ncbi:MAG: glycosyltransferase family 1 protein [Pseudomonadota bacterium]
MSIGWQAARTVAARRVGGWCAAIGAGFRPAQRRMLLISDDREYTSEQQFAPIWRHRSRLRHDLGLAVDWLPLDVALARGGGILAGYDSVGLKLSFRRPPDEAVAIVERFAAALATSRTKLVYFDGDDDSGILWPRLLALCDLYVKKHRFRDPADYARRFIGKSNLTDHVARTAGRSFADDIIPQAGGVDPALLDRLYLGWNIALDDKIAALDAYPPEADRRIDICSRAYAAPDDWLYGLRAPAVAALEALPDGWSVAVPRARAPQEAYYQEMRTARICVSPFGYGELCWRDFEAVLSGCLLVKPDMGHVLTAPDLFVPGETYIPVAWDYADLEAVCAPFLADEAARVEVAARAQRLLIDSLSADWFSARMAELLAALDRS